MRKKFCISVVIICIAILGCIAWTFLRSTPPSGPEPFYKGRPVRDWVGDIWFNNEEMNPQIKDVVAIGEPAVPYIIKGLGDPRPLYARGRVYAKFWKSMPTWLQNHLSDPRLPFDPGGDSKNLALVVVLARIGPSAKAAVPALTRIVKNKDARGTTRAAAIGALRHIGPAAKPAVSALLERLKDDHLRGRRQYFESAGPNLDSVADMWDLIQRGEAALAVACLDPSNHQALNPIRSLINVTNAQAQAYGAVALWRLHPEPGIQRIVEDHLRDQNFELRSYSVGALGQIGKPAESFVPLLTKMREETNPTNKFRLTLDYALESIASTAPAVVPLK